MKLRVGISLGTDEWESRGNSQLSNNKVHSIGYWASVQRAALWRQVDPPAFADIGYRPLGIDGWASGQDVD